MTALTRHPIGKVRADPDTRDLLKDIMMEALRVGQAAGVPIEDAIVAERLEFVDKLARRNPSVHGCGLNRGQAP
jgi:2-dehydropantoate 2-reductase